MVKKAGCWRWIAIKSLAILIILYRYHKTHLYFEEQFNSPIIAEHAIFTTDFNVTFGHFICYDIIFYNPAVELIGKGIQNIIYTSAWVDELPFLMGKNWNCILNDMLNFKMNI